ncbi:uncharacterized protein TNCV_57421 [Trichonephila clavipes]|nr:uncharacterized protein TNCV_57421 [Trichonephila clavipes]
MPRKRKSNLSQSSNIARPKKVPRFNQTFPQAELPRFEQAESEAAYRAAEIPEQFKLGVFSMQLILRLREIQKPLKQLNLANVLLLKGHNSGAKTRGGVFDKAAFEYDESLDYESHKLIKIEAMLNTADFAVLLNGKRNLQACIVRGVVLPSIDEPVEPLK